MHEAEKPERVHLPHRVSHAVEFEDGLEPLDRVLHVAAVERGHGRHEPGEQLDRRASADAEHIDQVVVVRAREEAERDGRGVLDLVRRQVVEAEQAEERVAGRLLTDGQVPATAEPPVGLGGRGGVERRDLGGEELNARVPAVGRRASTAAARRASAPALRTRCARRSAGRVRRRPSAHLRRHRARGTARRRRRRRRAAPGAPLLAVGGGARAPGLRVEARSG